MEGTKTPGKDLPTTDDCMDSMTMASYLDGTLDEAQQAACEAHFATCADCRQALAELNGLLSDESIVVPSVVRERAKRLVQHKEENSSTTETDSKPA
ncbi:MAG: anti-sigma factor family protein [Desulfovibrio sp.]|uniref:anti-sigma factor family protein n=1 Tax=Desulfovibrio sp. 7SRBS1 TaxID=3378064 RepID=UPI003B3EDFFF